jgi:glycosyltransferase involved in cell wall biosynthesis
MSSRAADDPRLSLVLTTRDRPSGFDRAVRALDAQAASEPGPPVELIVVFDGCRPYHGASLAQLGMDVHVRVNDLPRGIARARNQALRPASGEVVAFMDDDAVPADTWLGSLRRGLRRYPDRRCFGGRVRCAHEPANLIARLRDDVYYRETFGAWYAAPDGLGGPDLLGPPYVNGGNCAYRQTVFDEIGAFREDLPAYVDVEFGPRADCRRSGVLLDGLTIAHAHPTRLRPYLRRCYTSGQARRRLHHHRAHAPRAALTAIACNLAWRNVLRAGRLPVRQRLLGYVVLALQEVTHGCGYVRG